MEEDKRRQSFGGTERNLRPNRRLSYKSFFIQKALQLPINNGHTSKRLEAEEVLDNLERESFHSKRDTSIATMGTGEAIMSHQNVDLITPQSLASNPSTSLKRRRIESGASEVALPLSVTKIQSRQQSFKVPLRKAPLGRRAASFQTGEMVKIRQSLSNSSWHERKDCQIAAPSPSIDLKAFRQIFANSKSWETTLNPEVRTLLDEAKSQFISYADILITQKNRFKPFDRKRLIRHFIQRMVNFFGRHHETLYIAISLMDRFLAKVYLHTEKQKQVLAVTCAIVAIKFNEEFDPEIGSTLSSNPDLAHITARDIFNMERKLLAAVDWIVRPVTPQVVTYKILDSLPFKLPSSVKRFIVHIVEKGASITLSNCHHLFQAADNNLLEQSIVLTLEALFRRLFVGYSKEMFDIVGTIAGPGSLDTLPAAIFPILAKLPVVYGELISL